MAALWRSSGGVFGRGAVFYLLFWGYTGFVDPFLNVYYVSLGLTGAQVGLLSALLPAATLVLAPLVTGLGDRRAWRLPLLSACTLGVAVAYTTLGRAGAFKALLLGAVLLAIFRSPMSALADAVVVRMGLRHAVDFGKMRLWGSLSFAVIAILAGVLWQRIGLAAMFPAASAGLLLLMAGRFLLQEEGPATHQAASSWRWLLQNRQALVLLAATILLAAGRQMSWVFGALNIDRLGGGPAVIGLLAGLSGLCEVGPMAWSGRIMRHLGERRTLLVAYGLFVLGAVMGAVAQTPALLLLMGIAHGVSYGIFLPATVVTFDRLAPGHSPASAQGVLNAGGWGLAPLVASLVGGLLYDVWPASVLLLCAVLGLFAMLVLGVLARLPSAGSTLHREGEIA